MSFMSLLTKLFRPKIKDTSDKQRLIVARNERPLREGFNYGHFEVVKEARELKFQNTADIRRVK